MYLECKYHTQIIQSLVNMQSTHRLPLESIRDWAIDNRVAIYMVKNYFDFGLVGKELVPISDNQRWIASQYRYLEFAISLLEKFYQIHSQGDYALSAVIEFKDCNDDKNLIIDWLIRHYKLYKKCFLFMLDYSHNLGDASEEGQYVFSSNYLKVVIGFETSSFAPAEEFMSIYFDFLNNYDLWDKIDNLFEQNRNTIVKFVY